MNEAVASNIIEFVFNLVPFRAGRDSGCHLSLRFFAGQHTGHPLCLRSENACELEVRINPSAVSRQDYGYDDGELLSYSADAALCGDAERSD